MPWQTPKTTWTSADVVGPDDLNRIEENIRVHAEDKNNPHSVTPEQIGAVSKAGDTMNGPLRTLHENPIILKQAGYKSFVVHHPKRDSIIITSSASKDGEDWNWGRQVELTADGVLKVMGYPVWHSGNHGPGSGLNADLLDGKHLSDIISNIASNANGSYVRLGDVQVCWKYEPNPSFEGATTFQAFGETVYENRLTWTYPAPFAGTPAVFATPTTSGFSSADVYLIGNDLAKIRFKNSINQFSGPISLIAIGRWR